MMAVMNKTETNALRIAELMGVKTHISIIGAFGTVIDKIPNTGVINKFMEYNGLMPIAFECNTSHTSKIQNSCLYERDFIRFIDFERHYEPDDDFDYNTEPEFIEALQLACIKYLELRNEN